MDREKKYINKPCYPELWLIILTGVLHVTVELVWGATEGGMSQVAWPERIYNLAAILVWGCYVIWRAVGTRGAAHAWGFRRDNFLAALRPSLLFSIPVATVLFIYGRAMGRWTIPPIFWIVLFLYPLYGITQQFALQVLIAKNLRDIVRMRPIRILLAASLFSAAHFPNCWLMGLTFPAGLMFTWIYERHLNIWAIGISHGLLGAFAYYCVLGLDPGAEMLEGLRRFLF